MQLDLGLPSQNFRDVPPFARRAEELGFGGLWTIETQHDPFLPLAIAATATHKIRLGTSIAVAFARSPMILAHTVWDLQRASQGRFILGLGTQIKAHNERRFSVKFESPGPKLREVVLALRAIWNCWQDDGKLNFKGEFYRFDLMTPFFNSGPIENPQIPIYLAGVNNFMCRIAGEVGDGLHVHPLHSAKYLREHIHPAVEDGLRISGRLRRDFTYCASVFMVLGETEAERLQWEHHFRQQIAFYGSTPAYEPVFAAHGWTEVAKSLHLKSRQGDWSGMPVLITDKMLDEFCVAGTYATIGNKLHERYAGLLDRITPYLPLEMAVDYARLGQVNQILNPV